MTTPSTFFKLLKKNGFSLFTGVPDSHLKDFLVSIDKNIGNKAEHIIAANEGSAVGLAIGHYLATKKKAFVYMQNSGLGNALNPLISLASSEVYGIPMLLMIGWRGMPGTKDEPQHMLQGRITESLLKTMGIPYKTLDPSCTNYEKFINDCVDTMERLNVPVAILVEKNVFNRNVEKGSLKPSDFTRENALEKVASLLPKGSVVVCTTGMASRELFELRKSTYKHSVNFDFYTVGGMGHASKIALGIALAQPNRQVFCFDGDGAAIMHMGSLGIIGQSNAKNLTHVLFNNGQHASVGGQPTIGDLISFVGIAKSCGYKESRKITKEDEITEKIFSRVEDVGPRFIEIKIQPGHRSNLGRPDSSPRENKEKLMSSLQLL